MPSVQRYSTDYKLGRPVIEPSKISGRYDSISTDVPFVFYHGDKIYLMHVGFDGKGYQTALACADSPEGPFEDIAVILKRDEEGRWDSANSAGVWMLSTHELFTTRTLKKWQGKYWLYYHAYPGEGYEEGAAAIGAAWCEKEDLSEWHRLKEPILTVKDAANWEKGGLYKNCTVEHDGKYYLFYNAKDETYGAWKEQIGICVSEDPLHFTRLPHQPALPVSENGWDKLFASDPWVVYDAAQKLWVMYYYGYNGVQACDGIAFSTDLIHWEKAPDPLIVPGPAGSIDDLFAHKPAILWYQNKLYHYYCCCQKKLEEAPYGEHRTLTVACSQPWPGCVSSAE